jgi:Fe-S oxidoreductase
MSARALPGVIDEPRAILQAIKGVELVEPEWTNGAMSTCCGGAWI